jgi:hypothetical protein
MQNAEVFAIRNKVEVAGYMSQPAAAVKLARTVTGHSGIQK